MLTVHAARLAASGPAGLSCSSRWRAPRPAARSGRERPSVAALASSDTETEELAPASGSGTDPSDSGAASLAALQHAAAERGRRIAVLQATKAASVPVQEGGRPLAEYMALPASQYSVLDARRIERLGPDTFRCYVGGFKFFSFEVEPVITVSVVVGPRGPTVRLLSTKLQGSKVVEQMNDRFDATMCNVVEWRDCQLGADGAVATDCHSLASETALRVALEVPGWFVLPTAAIERTGSGIMRSVLERAVPRFLAQLADDYALWASGDASRRALADKLDAASADQP